MNLTLMKYDWRDLRWITLLLCMMAVGLTLFLPAPFSPGSYQGPHSIVYPVLSIVSAILVALKCFDDPVGVSTWVMTRGLTRHTQFQTRWLTGLLVLLLPAVLIAATMMLGLRQLVQQAMGNGFWYPMARTGEVSVVRDFLLLGLVTYCVTVFVTRIHQLGWQGQRQGMIHGVSRAATVITVLVLGFCWHVPLATETVPLGMYVIAWGLTCAVLTVAARAACAQCEMQQ